MSRRSLLREVLASGAGKLGVAMALILGVAAIIVVATFPLDFGPTRWSDPSVWVDYPKAVPPAWSAAFAADRPAEHRILEANEPSDSTARGAARVETYDLPFTVDGDEPPTFVSFSHGALTFQDSAARPQPRVAAAGRHGGDPVAVLGARPAPR